eukprot:g735.t1
MLLSIGASHTVESGSLKMDSTVGGPSLLQRVAAAVEDPETQLAVGALLESRRGASSDELGGERVPVYERAVSVHFLRDFLVCLGKLSPGQIVHGKHTHGSPDDWKHFDMDQDPHCIRGITRDICGLSFVETLMLLDKVSGEENFTHSQTGEPYFGSVDIFCSYGWHGTRLDDLKNAVAFYLSQHDDSDASAPTYFWIDIFAVAQNRDTEERRAANAADVGSFAEVINKSRATALYWSPISRPAVIDRVWCLYEILRTHKSGNSLELLLQSEDRTSLLESIAADNGRSLRFLIEGQSSVNASSTYERDFCRIHSSIEVELNPSSLGNFVQAPETINGMPFGNKNASEGWLGDGQWVEKGKVVGPGVPPWIDYVFIEEEGRGEMDGAKEGHYILDRVVRDAVYEMFRNILKRESLPGVSSEPIMELEPLLTPDDDIEAAGEDSDDTLWQFIIVNMCEVSTSGHKYLAGLTEGKLLTLWDLDESGEIISQIIQRQLNGCICSCMSEGLFVTGLRTVDDDDEDEDEEDEDEEEEEEEKATNSQDVKQKKNKLQSEGVSDEEGASQGRRDEDDGEDAADEDDDLDGCLAVWRFLPKGEDEELSPLEITDQLLDLRDVSDCIDAVSIITPLSGANAQTNTFAVADPYKSCIGIVTVTNGGEVSLQEVIEAPITLPIASSIVSMQASRNWLAASYRSGPVALFIADTTSKPCLHPMHILSVTGVHSMVLTQQANGADEDVVVYTAGRSGLFTWRVEA